MLLVRKSGNHNQSKWGSSVEQPVVEPTSSADRQHKHDPGVRVTPTPRSFSDIFTGRKMVLVKKNSHVAQPNPILSTTSPPTHHDDSTAITSPSNANTTSTLYTISIVATSSQPPNPIQM